MDAESKPDVDDTLPEQVTCWCGATGPYEDLFCYDDLEESCGGTGYLHCSCGGDLCVCHWHGGTECDGCEDCEPGGEGYDDYEYDYRDD